MVNSTIGKCLATIRLCHYAPCNSSEWTSLPIKLLLIPTYNKKQKQSKWNLTHAPTALLVWFFYSCSPLLSPLWFFHLLNEWRYIFSNLFQSSIYICICGLSLASHLWNFYKLEHKMCFLCPISSTQWSWLYH